MTTLPSKELLSIVLDCEVLDSVIKDNTIWPLEFSSWRSGEIQLCNCKKYRSGINIHELAHMVKEWARTEKQILLASSSNGICEFVRKDIEATYAATEPEAVFKAGEWLLKDRR